MGLATAPGVTGIRPLLVRGWSWVTIRSQAVVYAQRRPLHTPDVEPD